MALWSKFDNPAVLEGESARVTYLELSLLWSLQPKASSLVVYHKRFTAAVMASGEGNVSPPFADFEAAKQESSTLEGLMTNLSRSIKQTNWLQDNNATQWAKDNPDAYAQWMDAIKDRQQQSSSSQTAVAASESTGSQTPSVSSQHMGSQTPSVSSQSSSSQTNVLGQDAAVP